MSDLKEVKLLKKIDELQKKVNNLYKYKNFIELEKNSKSFYEKFEKINNNNILLVNHIKTQKNTITLLIQERDEYKKKLIKLNDDGLNFVNKKKFYEVNLKINDLEKSNEELKNIIKNKEEIFLNLNLEITELKKNNLKLDNLVKEFVFKYNSINNKEIEEEEIIEKKVFEDSKTKTKSNKSIKKYQDSKGTKKGYESDNENTESEKIEKISDIDNDDYELDDDILL